MNRRNFLSLAALAIAGKAAERVFPFRVYSIPKEIVVASNMPPLMFGGLDIDPAFENTGTAALMRYQSAVSRDMMLYGNGAITPEMFRRAQKQIIERLGASPLEINSYPLP